MVKATRVIPFFCEKQGVRQMRKIKIFHVVYPVLVLFLTMSALSVSATYASSRTALVIGNSQYQSAPLKNPVNDAEDIASLLKQYNFNVKIILNASHREMKKGIRSFGRQLRQTGGVGLFYFSGHGMQLKGRNYLIPVQSTIESEGDVEFEAVDAGLILNKMEDAGNNINIIILDACRNNPFVRSFRTSTPGLARMDGPTGSLIAYATAPGSVAADGEKRNGIYTKHLLINMRKPGLTIEQVLKKVRVGVLYETGKKQTPWELSSMTGDFYLAGKKASEILPPGSRSASVLQINSDPVGADIFIRGKFSGTAPLEIRDIDPGRYEIKAILSGYKAEKKKVVVNRERRAVVNFFLDPVDSKARLYVTTNPLGCRVRIMNIVPVFYNGIELDPGIYKLEVSKRGYGTKVHNVSITSSQVIDLYVELKKKSIKYGDNDSKVPGQIWTEPVTGMEFVWVPRGCYQMGSNLGGSDEKPVHEVCLDGFWIAMHEVTQGQYKKITGSNPSSFKLRDDYPVERVSWNDAKKFISRLNQQSDVKFALPSEAQWEYAARSGGKDEEYSGGNNINFFAVYVHNSHGETHRVGSKTPNGLGIYDMSGNVYEWCEDIYDSEAYSKHTRDNPVIVYGGSERVRRGGSWIDFSEKTRCAFRNRDRASGTYGNLGFRLIRED